jgi:hypothetical protein
MELQKPTGVNNASRFLFLCYNKNMQDDIEHYYEINKLFDRKDYEAMRQYGGYVATGKHSPIAGIIPPEPAKWITLLEFIKDEPRGNHYHKIKREYMLVLNGKLEYKLFFPDSPDDFQTVLLEVGQQINVKPGLAHIVTAREVDALAIETSPDVLILDDNILL